jgi:hypothetical protein
MLGWGILYLMPYDVINTAWVEQKMGIAQWRIWLSVVERVNPDAAATSRELNNWLGVECITGGPITQQKLLGIKAVAD